MKLSELAAGSDELRLLRDGEFSAFGFCELQQTADMLVYITSESYIQRVMENPNVRAVLTTPWIAERLLDTGLGLITADDPAVSFCRLHNRCARSGLLYHMIDQPDTVIGEQCQISPRACIAEKGVVLGDRVIVEPGAVIRGNVTIGNDCFIGANSVIGVEGFKLYRVGSELIDMDHVGGVKIGDRVYISPCASIDTGIIEPTVIESDVRIAPHVQISHSVVIGESTIITAGVIICGSVRIGKRVWIGVNSAIKPLVEIGDNAYICIGSAVARSVKAGAKVSGNLAEDHMRRVMREKRLENLLRGKKTEIDG